MNVRHLSRLTTFAFVVGCLISGCVSTQTVDGPADPRRADAPIGARTPAATTTTTTTTTTTAPKSIAPRQVVALDPVDPIINVRLVFSAGAADDPRGKEGLTRLTALLMKEATADLDAAAFADALFPLAAEFGVQVDKGATVFVARAHKDHEKTLLKLLGDVVTRPRFDAADFARLRDEQLAFLRSTLRTGNDEALQREALELTLYPSTHPYGHTPAGTIAGLKAITLADVTAHHDALFARDRLTIGVSGGASTAFVDALSQRLAQLPAQSVPREAISVPATATKNRLVIVDKPSAGTAISLGFVLPTLNRAHPDYAAMKLAETWFGEHRNLIGHLFNSMREVRGLNYGDYAYIEHFVEEPGSTFERTNIPRATQYFSMWIRPVEHKNRLFALKMAAWELSRFAASGIPDDASFKRVQDFVVGYWPSKEAEPMRRLGYQIDESLTGLPFDRAGLRAAVAGLDRTQVNAAIRRHLVSTGLSFVVVTQDAAALKKAIVDKQVPILAVDGADAAVLADNAAIGAFDLGLNADTVVVVAPTFFFER